MIYVNSFTNTKLKNLTGKHDDIVMAILAGVKAYIDDTTIGDYGSVSVRNQEASNPLFSKQKQTGATLNILNRENPYR